MIGIRSLKRISALAYIHTYLGTVQTTDAFDENKNTQHDNLYGHNTEDD